MLADISNVDAIYIVCGRTDMRKSIDGLCAIIQEQFSMEIDHSLYLFCGRKCDRIKAILKEPDGIVMIYKRLTAQGSYRWPRDKSEVRNLTWREFDWLMSGEYSCAAEPPVRGIVAHSHRRGGSLECRLFRSRE